MKELLPFLPKPSHYLGQEINSVHKDRSRVSIHVGLAFPDVYQVGMSYLGQKILYHCINRHEDFYAERVFAPSLDAAGILRQHNVSLCTLESDTPLKNLNVLAFSLTHELCYTNILYMLDLAGIPFRSRDRDGTLPLVIAGGGAVFNAEPVADFFDLMVLGEGEEVIIHILREMSRSRVLDRHALLKRLKQIPGVYVPGFFKFHGPGLPLEPLYPEYDVVRKALVQDLNQVPFPDRQVVPYGKVIHDRLSIEIARGCTRGCRFCQAGNIYRPVRERNIPCILESIHSGLAATGMEELSFLSLSSGDFSSLEDLFFKSFARCQQEQVSIALPSLRAGSVNKRLMQLMARIRRTHATLAPEAGTDRLRRVINKGITEQEILEHTGHLFDLGWQGVKLYFMIGLPTETQEDILGIRDLCHKVLKTGRAGEKRPQVTASVSPFVPKAQTPFQWDRQAGPDSIKDGLYMLKDLFKEHKGLNLKWHTPEMSLLEGIFSRGGRELTDTVEQAYLQDQTFTSWSDCFQLRPWLDILDGSGLDPEHYLQARDPDQPLPWNHLHSGTSRRFLLTERKRALSGKTTLDCRYNVCRMCGVCDRKGQPSLLGPAGRQQPVKHFLNMDHRDQDDESFRLDIQQKDLSAKKVHLRIWHEKIGFCKYLSQLELQSLLERAMRRAGWPLTFSRGFRPAPVISFGRALPVGVASMAEWFNIYLRDHLEERDLLKSINLNLPRDMQAYALEYLSLSRRQPQAVAEEFRLDFNLSMQELHNAAQKWQAFESAENFIVSRQTPKGARSRDLCRLVKEAHWRDNSLFVLLLWHEEYLSPLFILQSIFPDYGPERMSITKTRQIMA